MPPRGRPKASGVGRGKAAEPPPAPDVSNASEGAPAVESQPDAPPAPPAPARQSVARQSTRSGTRSTGRGGASTRGKKAVPQPTFKGRRTQEERDAIQKELLEKERLKRQEAEAAQRKLHRGGNRGGHRGRGDRGGRDRGRGGTLMGLSVSALSGPFSAAPSLSGTGSGGRRPQYGGSSGSHAVVVKDEPGVKREPGNSGFSQARNSTVKTESGGEFGGEFSDFEDDKNDENKTPRSPRQPRKNVDMIEIPSDEEEPSDIKQTGLGHENAFVLRPIRITRHEHQKREKGINTDASSAGAANINAVGDDADEGEAAPKGKGKAKDVEITEVRGPYKGMWQDEEDEVDKENLIQIKDEPMEDAEMVPVPDAPQSPQTEKKRKIRQEPASSTVLGTPALQTEEERQEWARYQRSLEVMREELGPPEAVEERDKNGDVAMTDGGETSAQPSVTKNPRDNAVYLVQLPPIMPNLLRSGAKKDTAEATDAVVPSIEEEETEVKEGDTPVPESDTHGLHLLSGRGGKLYVLQSGRAYLTWGDIVFELKEGIVPRFLQETVSMSVTPPRDRMIDNDGGTAVSFGPVKGKFVVTPYMRDLLR